MAMPQSIVEIQKLNPEDAGSLSIMAKSMEQMALLMRQTLITLGGVDAKVESRLSEFEEKMQADVVNPLQKRMSEIEAKQRDSILVSPLERQKIREAVNRKAYHFGGDRKHFAKIYGRLHREFGIPSYEFLRAVDLDLALRYVDAYDGERSTWLVPKAG